MVEELKQKIKELEDALEKEKKLNEYFKSRFVSVNTCTDDDKRKCLMFHEDLCSGERCQKLIDLEALIKYD